MLTETSPLPVLPWPPVPGGVPDAPFPVDPDQLFSLIRQQFVVRNLLASFLGISEKTLDRRFRDERWDRAESYRLGLLLSLRHQAETVFGDPARASLWLQTPVPALDNQAPLALLDTVSGFERARNSLLRQAYGMY